MTPEQTLANTFYTVLKPFQSTLELGDITIKEEKSPPTYEQRMASIKSSAGEVTMQERENLQTDSAIDPSVFSKAINGTEIHVRIGQKFGSELTTALKTAIDDLYEHIDYSIGLKKDYEADVNLLANTITPQNLKQQIGFRLTQ